MLESTQRSKVAFPSEYIYHIVCTLSVVAEVIKNLGLKIRNSKLFSHSIFLILWMKMMIIYSKHYYKGIRLQDSWGIECNVANPVVFICSDLFHMTVPWILWWNICTLHPHFYGLYLLSTVLIPKCHIIRAVLW